MEHYNYVNEKRRKNTYNTKSLKGEGCAINAALVHNETYVNEKRRKNTYNTKSLKGEGCAINAALVHNETFF